MSTVLRLLSFVLMKAHFGGNSCLYVSFILWDSFFISERLNLHQNVRETSSLRTAKNKGKTECLDLTRGESNIPVF